MQEMIIDCISDLHGFYPKLEGGDLLIIAGDLTARDTQQQHFEFLSWLLSQNYKKKIWISGNHDNYLINTTYIPIKDTGLEYLCDSGNEFEGLNIWGSPWTKRFKGMNPNCMAFTVDTDEELAEKWLTLPKDIDILITHSPPYDLLDKNREGKCCGSKSLLKQILNIRPKICIWGHIHEEGQRSLDLPFSKCINASYVDEYYRPRNQIQRIIYSSEGIEIQTRKLEV